MFILQEAETHCEMMTAQLSHLTFNELIDKLVELSDQCSSQRGIDPDHDLWKMQIQAIQEEIALRRQALIPKPLLH